MISFLILIFLSFFLIFSVRNNFLTNLFSCSEILQAGGLDPYLLTTPSTTLGFLGNHLRQLVLSSRAVSSAIPSPTTGRITKEERYVMRKLLDLGERSGKELTLGEMKKMREAWKEMRKTGYTGGVPVESVTE